MHFRETLTPQPATNRNMPTPYCLAEELPRSELEAQLETAAIPRESDWYPERQLIHVAWAYTELALSTEIDDKTADELFYKAQATTIEIKEGEYQRYHHELDAQLLYAYLPAFHQRRKGLAWTPETRQAAYRRLPRIFDDIEKRELKDDGDVVGHFVKACAHMAFLRYKNIGGLDTGLDTQNLEVYPASSREHWNQGPLQSFNHDFSAVIGGQKTPITMRSWKRSPKREGKGSYDEQLLFVAFSKLANQAMRSYGLEDGDGVILDLANILTDEAEGKNLAIAERAALDKITSSLTIAALQHGANLHYRERQSSPEL